MHVALIKMMLEDVAHLAKARQIYLQVVDALSIKYLVAVIFIWVFKTGVSSETPLQSLKRLI